MRPAPCLTSCVRTVAALVSAGALTISLAACSSGSNSSAPPATAATTTSTTASTTTSTTSGASTTSAPTSTAPPTSATPTTAFADECTADELGVTLGRSGAAAGTAYAAIVFTNRGSRTCAMRGYPGVSYVDASGTQIGVAARRDPNPPETTVSLAPGAAAHALFGTAQAANYPPDACGSSIVPAAVHVYPPDSTTAIDVSTGYANAGAHDVAGGVCTNDVGQLSIQSVAAGADTGAGTGP